MGKKRLEFFKYLGERVRRYNTLFKTFIDNLVKEYDGKLTIFLFGSRARGDNRPSSDFDILIVVEEGKLEDHYLKSMKCKPPELPVDILIVYPQDLSNPIIKQMLVDSKVIFNGLSIDLTVFQKR